MNSPDIWYNCMADFNTDGSIKASYAMDLDWKCSIKNEDTDYLVAHCA